MHMHEKHIETEKNTANISVFIAIIIIMSITESLREDS